MMPESFNTGHVEVVTIFQKPGHMEHETQSSYLPSTYAYIPITYTLCYRKLPQINLNLYHLSVSTRRSSGGMAFLQFVSSFFRRDLTRWSNVSNVLGGILRKLKTLRKYHTNSKATKRSIKNSQMN